MTAENTQNAGAKDKYVVIAEKLLNHRGNCGVGQDDIDEYAQILREAFPISSGAEITNLRDRLDVSRDALEVFARIYRMNEPIAQGWGREKPNWEFMPRVWPVWGDFKKAHDALSGSV